jgi:hypothetical protein
MIEVLLLFQGFYRDVYPTFRPLDRDAIAEFSQSVG